MLWNIWDAAFTNVLYVLFTDTSQFLGFLDQADVKIISQSLLCTEPVSSLELPYQ